MKTERFWMVVGPAGGIACFYGVTRTRNEMIARFKANGWTLYGNRIVRVTVTA